MGLGMLFGYYAFHEPGQRLADNPIFDLMVQRAYGVMTNDVLISIPLFVFMGYIIERANVIDRLFKSIQLAAGAIPGSLAVATVVACAIFATATGIVGAVVTLMGLLAFPAMLRAGYDLKLSAGAITAGGCLGILIPVDHAHPLRGDRRGLGGEALRRGLLPRDRAVRPVRAVHRRAGDPEPQARSQAPGRGAAPPSSPPSGCSHLVLSPGAAHPCGAGEHRLRVATPHRGRGSGLLLGACF